MRARIRIKENVLCRQIMYLKIGSFLIGMKSSIEDKYSLIAKIESSLGDVDMSELTNLIHGIPREVMIAAAEHALKENRAGRCILNSQVESYIKAKRGWK